MKQKIQQKHQSIYRLLSIALAISLLFTALIFSPQAAETDIIPLWEWNPGTPQVPLYHHMRFFDEGVIPASISDRGIQLLRAGIAFPDGVRIDENWNVIRTGQVNTVHPDIRCDCYAAGYNINLNMGVFRLFHGYHAFMSVRGNTPSEHEWDRANYVSAFTLITMIANVGGDIALLRQGTGSNARDLRPSDVGLSPEAFNRIIGRFQRTDGATAVEGMRCGTCHTFKTWYQIMEINGLRAAYEGHDDQGQHSFRRHFIWGIALHALTDTFEHSGVIRDLDYPAGRWHMMNSANENKDRAVELSWDAAQIAFNYALQVMVRTSGRRYGCYRAFMFAVPEFHEDFRLANLLDFATENSIAINGSLH